MTFSLLAHLAYVVPYGTDADGYTSVQSSRPHQLNPSATITTIVSQLETANTDLRADRPTHQPDLTRLDRSRVQIFDRLAPTRVTLKPPARAAPHYDPVVVRFGLELG